jgi:hypothetical protein
MSESGEALEEQERSKIQFSTSSDREQRDNDH